MDATFATPYYPTQLLSRLLKEVDHEWKHGCRGAYIIEYDLFLSFTLKSTFLHKIRPHQLINNTIMLEPKSRVRDEFEVSIC